MSTTVSSLVTNASLHLHHMKSFLMMVSTANPSFSKLNLTRNFLASCLKWNQTIGTDISGTDKCVPSPFTIFSFPPKVLLSGFRSRCHIVITGAFPEPRAQQGLDQLIHLYTRAGFPKEELQAISNHILIQHQNLEPPKQTCAFFLTGVAGLKLWLDSCLCPFLLFFSSPLLFLSSSFPFLPSHAD